MQISKIVVENVKGIARVEMCPIKPINVLIGRNNSGKTTILGSLRLLTQYFDTVKDQIPASRKAFRVPAEFIRRGDKPDQNLRITVTILQSIEERRQQFLSAVSAWNSQYQRPKMDARRIDVQLEKELLQIITFGFSARASGEQFGLESIATTSPDEPHGADIIVARASTPGQSLKRIAFRGLFTEVNRDRYQTIHEVAQRQGFANEVDIQVSATGLSCDKPIFVQNLLQPGFEFVRDCFSSVSVLSAYRHGEEKTAPQKCDTLADNGTGLVSFVHNLIMNNHSLFTEIAKLVKCIVPEVGRLHARFTGTEDHAIELAYEWPDGRVVNLANMGGGVEQLVILGCLLLAQKTTCILWEEPESHLHPGAQDKVLSELESRIGQNLMFLTTHSPVFVRASDKIAVHTVTNLDGKSATGRTLRKEQLQEACTILGRRPGHLAQADVALYVEGKYGAAVVEEWLKKWPQREAILGHLLLVVQPCNPDEIGTDDFDLGTLKKLTPNMILFVDSDNDKGSPDPKESRKKLAKMCQEHGIPCIITKLRQIEDYFPHKCVKAGLPENLRRVWTYDPNKPMGEQLGAKWKKHNRRIAEEMDWSDIEKHEDLVAIFARVKEFAKALTP